MGETPEEKVIREYLSTQTILIAEKSSSIRGTISSVLNHLGANRASISMVPSYEYAEDIFESKNPSVVICDYFLGDRCGLEILQHQRAKNQDSADSIFILITSTATQTSVAEAAEEDVDDFILKPISAKTLDERLRRTFIKKLMPDTYSMFISHGKSLIRSNDIEEALEVLHKAVEVASNPSLAHYYIGEIRRIQDSMEGAETSFLSGLEFNDIHYKCLTGLYESRELQGKTKEAYSAAKKLAGVFPVTPQRLDTFIQLAIKTSNFKDVEFYCQIFDTLFYRPDSLVKCYTAALIVCSKFYLRNGQKKAAIALFLRIAIAALDDPVILKKICVICHRYKLVPEATKYLKRFRSEDQGSEEYSISRLIAEDLDGTPAQVIQDGRALLFEGCHDPFLYEILIRRSIENGSMNMAEDFLDQAKSKIPDHAERLQKMFDQKKD